MSYVIFYIFLKLDDGGTHISSYRIITSPLSECIFVFIISLTEELGREFVDNFFSKLVFISLSIPSYCLLFSRIHSLRPEFFRKHVIVY